MGDVVVGLCAVLLVVAVFFGLGWFIIERQRGQLAHSAPVTPRPDRIAAVQAAVCYHLAQQAVVELDKLLDADTTTGMVVISPAARRRIEKIHEEFYNL